MSPTRVTIASSCPGDTVLVCAMEEEGKTVGDLCEASFRAQPHTW